MKIFISPETNLVMDSMTSVISKEKSTEDYSALISALTETEHHIDGLINSLSLNKPVLNSWKNREKTFLFAGLITNIFYGILIGILLLLFLFVIYYVLG